MSGIDLNDTPSLEGGQHAAHGAHSVILANANVLIYAFRRDATHLCLPILAE